MARCLGQIVRQAHPKSDNLMVDIRANVPDTIAYITKIGVQIPKDKIVIIDKKEFQMGRTGRLEFDNLKLNSTIYVKDKYDNYSAQLIPVIIDFIYIDKE